MSLGLLSVTAHAEEIVVPAYHVYGLYTMERTSGVTNTLGGVTWYPNNGSGTTEWWESDVTNKVFYSSTDFIASYSFAIDDALSFTKGNENVTIYIENIGKVKARFYNDSIPAGEVFKVTPSIVSMTVVYTDGTRADVSCTWTDKTDELFNVEASFAPSGDIQKIVLSVTGTLNKSVYQNYLKSDNSSKVSVLGAEEYGDNTFILKIEQSSEEAGLLSGILGKITDLWRTAEAGFANIVKGITELPQKLWSLIEDGLKKLFVPSEETMTAYKDKWDQLLAERFGAVYQVVNILTESWDEVMAADQTDTIDFPSATINLSGTPFTFGGYTVKIVPDGFSALVTAIKLIVGIVCSVAFVNGLRKRYDEIMGVEQ